MVNYLAILVSSVALFIFGWLWYGPLFGKQWMSLSGVRPGKSGKESMGWRMGLAFISNLVMAYVTAHFVAYTGAASFISGLVTGFWLWLGFIATVLLGGFLWEKKPFTLYVLNAAYNLVSLMLLGGILAVWA